MDVTRIDIDEVVIEGMPPSAREIPEYLRAAVADALRKRGVAEPTTGRTAERVSTEVTRSINR